MNDWTHIYLCCLLLWTDRVAVNSNNWPILPLDNRPLHSVNLSKSAMWSDTQVAEEDGLLNR